MKFPPDRDLHKLDPVFRARVLLLLERLEALGHDPVVHEAFRSFERAAYLADHGKGVARSMHCYGLAVDIISDREHWSPPPAFWTDLRDQCEALGMTAGARFKTKARPEGDSDHVQAVHVSDQDEVRAGTPEQIAAIVRRRLPPLPEGA